MASPRPTTRGTGMTAFSSPTSYEEEEDGDDGMFSYLPPNTSQGGPPSTGGFHRSAQHSAVAPPQPLVPLLLRTDSTSQPNLIIGTQSDASVQDLDVEKSQPHSVHAGLPALDPNVLQSPQLRREYEQGYTVGKHHHQVPPTATTFSTDANGSPIIELSDRIKMARMASEASMNSEKLAEKDGLGQAPATGISMTYSQAMAQIDELDPEMEDSPYPEVRASVSNIDDPEMPALTFRVWVLGFLLSILIGGLNQFFSLRQPSLFLTPILVLIVAYPLGKMMARLLPTHIFSTPKWMQRLGVGEYVSLNPGPFNVKEHTIIVIMANTANSQGYALFLTLTLDKFYHTPKGLGMDILLMLSNQILGFGFAGLARRFLVWPASMIWPANLVYCTLFNTFHAEDDDGSDGSMTRFRFFSWVALISGVWWFLPGYLFTAVSWFSWICWITPGNVVINQVFGVVSGLGGSLLTFDWSQISYIGSPLIVPFWAEVNVFAGFVFFLWFLTPIFYYSNLWYFAYMPILSAGLFDRYGAPYNVSAVLDTNSMTFNQTAYEEYSPLYLPVSYASLYSTSFALCTAIVTHTLLYHGPMMWQKIRSYRAESEDVHAKLMRSYPEVPDWWYWVLLGITFLLGVIAVEVYDTGLPVWALMLAIGIGALYVLPAGFVYAQTALQVYVNIIAELIPGYILPGRPIAVMTFKAFTVQGLYASINFIQDLKLGHYMKIPPRVTFIMQLLATIASALVQVGIKTWMVDAVPDLCSPDQESRLVCPPTRVFFSTSIIWGIIGPARQFSPGSLYYPLVYWALIGAVLPIPFWFLARRYPKSWLRYVNIPVILTGSTYIGQVTGINYSSWFLVAFIFQFVIRRRHFRWWSKFNFVTSAGLDFGTLIATILIFLCLQLPKNGSITVDWWGNDVWQNTADYNGTSYLTAPEDGFGPSSWS